MTDFRRLHVFPLAHGLTLDLYRETGRFPVTERYCLVPQIRRATISIGANLAEGSGVGGKEFARYVGIALGSANELDYLLQVAEDLCFLKDQSFQPRIAQVSRMLAGLRRSIRGQ
jgi:four helix bundle protein